MKTDVNANLEQSQDKEGCKDQHLPTEIQKWPWGLGPPRPPIVKILKNMEQLKENPDGQTKRSNILAQPSMNMSSDSQHFRRKATVSLRQGLTPPTHPFQYPLVKRATIAIFQGFSGSCPERTASKEVKTAGVGEQLAENNESIGDLHMKSGCQCKFGAKSR